MNFTEEQLERYSRHIILKDIGVEGQIRIINGRVLIIGAGGLGSPAALYLAAAGVGTVGIVDSDIVELSNLQRQIIHFTKDLNTAKVHSAAEKMKALNPDVTVKVCPEFIRADNIRHIIKGYEFVIDGTDNFAAKFLINDACMMEGIAFSHGGILRFNGQTMTVIPGKTACYRCVFEAPPPDNAVPSCAQAGVLGAIAGILGTIQTAEALKFLAGAGTLLTDRLLYFNALTMDFTKHRLQKNRHCPLCGDHPTIHELFDEHQRTCDLKAAAHS
ncbi:MAG: HesA/MoeB/ThiF family protein [Deltaproteobacteria bacterium]|nr:HesA/MoeB/ThiF family protein [Deltaproteobacteria bacterium]MBW2152426.1 HesA/MoeB/ThiF family protein [Deltaproteobacteria bacterium]